MKKLSFILSLTVIFISACTKTPELYFEHQDSVYFDFDDPKKPGTRVDSLFYSFALYPEKATDTIFLPVKIAGKRSGVDRKFAIRVVDSLTNAEAGKHYKALDAEYILPADSGNVRVPFIIFSSDPALQSKTVRVKLQLVATKDLGVEITRYDSAKVIFSNRLEKPSWWEVWKGELGDYSRVKHELFVRVSGTTDLPMTQDAQLIPKVLYHTRTMRNFLSNPITWVEENPAAGYTVEAAENGNYNFFSISNPEKKYLLEKNPADNKYYFRDENGIRIQ